MTEHGDAEDVITITDEDTIDLLAQLAKETGETLEEALLNALKHLAESRGLDHGCVL